ncbi:rRNA biogenesis protein rrp5 [Elasticomyces elasticus]|nr:rRNA biogenesis protein rrp5 [Elasticomyces elasticus]KAK3645311.1 rRNA biogenesis protein rrp5 [Elasticomyces elasticus]KAK4919847.1 rRNA biogenesis protein rrp5 [Elasticomyces elasticus]KAK5752890.1 rRNA biogenesis protein rrp5 [Elasticomyces elasticus]
MAALKRKAVTDERPVKKAKAEDKRAPKTSEGKKDTQKSVVKSVLQAEDRSFPRGGGSVLTPIEKKQIRAQADRDVLFEAETGQKAPGLEDEEAELFSEDEAPQKVVNKKKEFSKKKDGKPKVEGSGIKIQGLSYKTLVVGSQVLGYVSAITGKDIALTLPNNLTGYVPITAVSPTITTRLETLLAADEAGQETEDVDLKQLFHIGQWLRASVTSTSSPSSSAEGGKDKRHISLTLSPQSVNGGLDAESVVVNSTIQASVRSVEDHGLVMDLGLSSQSADVKGFVSKKELGSAYPLETVQEGQTMLCLVTGKGSNGKVLKLSPDASRFSALGTGEKDTKAPVVNEAPVIDAFLPGTAVNILVVDSGAGGVAGKVMGMVEVSADVIHSGAAAGGAGDGKATVDLAAKYKIGSKVKGRIIWTLPGDDGARKVGVSLLEGALALPPPVGKLAENASPRQRGQAEGVEQGLPLSSTVEEAKVVFVLPERGLFLSLPEGGKAFAHISQISDTRIDVLSSSAGKYELGSSHRVRVISYNPLDGLYYVSLKQSTLEQTYLRLEDLEVGEVVSGVVERLILGGKSGITGVLVKISEGVTGLVPEVHLSDAALQHPERKFREGVSVKARVLSVDLEKRHLRLTLKKSLISDDGAAIWKSYEGLEAGMEGKGTVVKTMSTGAVVQFFGNVRAYLPAAEMSEGFIEKPEEHFRVGQTVQVHVVSVDKGREEMKVSCKAVETFSDEQSKAWEEVEGGQVVDGTVTEKGAESVMVDLENGLRGVVRLGHLADGAQAKAEGALKRVRVGQKMSELVVIGKLERSRQVLLSDKGSLVKAAKEKRLVCSFADVKEGGKVAGFVRNVAPEGVFVEFGNGVVGLVPKSQVSAEMVGVPGFGLVKDQTVFAWVMSVDSVKERFVLSLREQSGDVGGAEKKAKAVVGGGEVKMGMVVKAHVASVKATQLNVRLADGVQGRVDVSEVFDDWEGVGNKKAPLQRYKVNEELEVKVLGVHDARSHRFLPISHRQSKAPVFELSAKTSRVLEGSEDLLTLDTVQIGSTQVAFVNNHAEDCIWVNLSPNVRGRVALMDLSNDAGMLQKLEKNFPFGSALRVVVKNVDLATGRLDLTAKMGTEQVALTLADVSAGQVLPGRVTKVSERGLTVQLSDSLAGPVPLVELSDDFEEVDLGRYNKNDIVRVCVVDVDLPNKRVWLSLRASKVLSSSLPVRDAQISEIAQVKAGMLVRGFVKHVGDRGVIVALSGKVDAMVKIADLSDKYVKDWKSLVEVDQLVTGRILAVDVDAKVVQLSLKASHVDEDYTPPQGINDLTVGTVITGKVRKVEEFGAFIDIDDTLPKLSGLCHRSEMAAKRVQDARKLYSEGDVVKAKVLSVDVKARKISLGLKATYFADIDDEDEEMEDESEGEGVELGDEEDDEDDLSADGGVEVEDERDVQSDDEADQADNMDIDGDVSAKPTSGLKTTGFDWTGESFGATANGNVSDSEPDTAATKKRKNKKPEIKVDMTGDLDKYGPRSVSDFERQLLGQPNNSGLWIQYMAFQLQLSEIQKARDIAERALRTIHIRETEEKANIWIACMNLEVEYGDDERVEEIFKQACQVQDPLEMHEKLASIYIDSGKYGRADAIFERIVANKAFRASPDVWLNYATFLMGNMKDPARGRSMLSRALQSIPKEKNRPLTAKFAGLEFHSSQGDPERGRTIFETLIEQWPTWSSGWDMWVDLERSRLSQITAADEKLEAKEQVRTLYERMTAQKMKKRRAKFVFKRWLEFEEKEGGPKTVERVKTLAKEFVERLQATGGDEMEE